jgi:TRAP-type C4-dicarboxylate transport system permease small subunit
MLKPLGDFFDKVITGLAWLAGAMMVFALLIVCADVLLRYLFNKPMGWVMETCEYLLLYITFLPAAWILRNEGHVKVDIILNRLNVRQQTVVTGISSIIGGLTMLTILIFSISITFEYYQKKIPSLGNMRLPEYLILMAIPLGSLFFSIEFFRRAYRFFRHLGMLRKPGDYMNI